MDDLREKLLHYTDDLSENVDLRKEAIATIEQAAQYMEEDVLLHHSRALALAYLALTDGTDVEPVVRCKDCKNWIPGGYKSIDDPQNPQCGGRCWYSVIPRFENDFCSYGKRKEKET